VTHISLKGGVAIAADDSGTVAALGEFGLIGALSAWLTPAPGAPRALVGIGDDAAVLAAPDGRVVATTDFLLEGRHFRRDWSSATDVGRKAAARSLADIAAMGAVPTGLLVALAAPGDLPVSWARDLAAGLATECARAGAAVIGGDTARASSVLLAVTGLGDLAGRAPVRRSGAAPGDLVAVAGPLGAAAAGLALLSAGLGGPGLAESPAETNPADLPAWAESLVAAHLRPAPPYDAGPEASGLGATAMIDVSDGLLADLGHIAAASGVLIDVASARLRPGEPLLTAARAVLAARRHADLARTDCAPPPTPPGSPPVEAPSSEALRWALTGGEDHSLAATFPPEARLPPRWTVIGEVRQGHGVTVDGQPWTGPPGWDHFAPGSSTA
jgi:thiamine-monophosphate kinase